jgi:hypothetical protein
MLCLPLYWCNLFVCKLQSLTKSEFKTYIKTQSIIKSLKIRQNLCQISKMQLCGSLCYLYAFGCFCSWFCIFDGHLVIMSCKIMGIRTIIFYWWSLYSFVSYRIWFEWHTCCFMSCVSHAAVCTVRLSLFMNHLKMVLNKTETYVGVD